MADPAPPQLDDVTIERIVDGLAVEFAFVGIDYGRARRIIQAIASPSCVPNGVRWNKERGHYEEEVCLGCNQATRLRDCGCPAGTGWRKWTPTPDATPETCRDCGEPLVLAGYSGTAEVVTEVMLCVNCDRAKLPDLPDEQDEREIDQQLSGRWEK